MRPYLGKTHHKKRAGGVAQVPSSSPSTEKKKKRVFVNTALLEATKLSLLIADTYLPTFEPYDQDLPLHASLKSTPKG
jgi:hypothetical protein